MVCVEEGICWGPQRGPAVEQSWEGKGTTHLGGEGLPGLAHPISACFTGSYLHLTTATLLSKTPSPLVKQLFVAATGCPVLTVLPSYGVFSVFPTMPAGLWSLASLCVWLAWISVDGGCICIFEQQVTKEERRFKLGVCLSLLPAKACNTTRVYGAAWIT